MASELQYWQQTKMDAKKSPNSLLSLIQTRSLEIVLAPIAQHVAELLRMTSHGDKRVSLPELIPSALAVMESVQDMASIAQKISSESQDKELRAKLPTASDMTLKTAEKLLEAAGRLSENPLSHHSKAMLCSTTQSILEWTVQLLLVWDEGEVRKIFNAAQQALDRLSLVLGAKSMRGLVVCFGGFSEAMLLLLNLTDKRQKELTDASCKHRLLEALELLKITLPKFSHAMQAYVKAPKTPGKAEAKDSLGGEIAAALRSIMDIVYPLNREADNMAGNIMKVQRKLTTDGRYYIGPDLDRHLDAVIQNSMAVAHVSRRQYREAIQKLCGEVLSLRKNLQDLAEAICDDPDNHSTKQRFDRTAEHLRERLVELDRWVADSVVDQVTETFVEPSAPINHLVQAATSPGGPHLTPRSKSTTTVTPASTSSPESSPSPARYDDSMSGLTKQVDLFRRHSRKLSQVAAHAAQSSTNAKRVHTIKVLADSVDKLTPRVVTAALSVRRDPTNQQGQVELDSVRREWAEKVQQLTGAIDDIIDPEDFMAVSEANIQQDMDKCREAMLAGRWGELNKIVQGIAAKAKRVSEFGHTAVKQASDRAFKSSLAAAVNHLDKAIPLMLKSCEKVTSNPSRQDLHDHFVRSLRDLLEAIHNIQKVLSQEIDVPYTGTEGGLSEDEVDTFLPQSPASSKQQTSAEERMLRRSIERNKNHSRYIGRLGTAAAKQREERSRPSSVAESSDRQTQTFLDGWESGLSSLSQSMSSQTQTPRHRTRDQSLQVNLTDSISTSGYSQTTPLPPTPVKETPRPSSASGTVKSYVSPLQKLVTAAEKGDMEGLPLHASQLSTRTIRLTNIAESAAGTLKSDTELARTIKTKTSQVSCLVPQVIDKARRVARDPGQSMGELQVSTQKWAGHVRQLVDATQQANFPWSKTAGKLVTAAKAGKDIRKQKSHVSTQTDRMISIATMTMEAAATEEAIGNSDDSFTSQDPELREQVERVRVTLSEIAKLTPQFLSAASQAAASERAEGSATMEHLNLLSQEWATKAKVLMKQVDDVSLGMGGAADTLLLSAKSGDPTLLEDQIKSIESLADSLQEVAEDAVEGCTDLEKMEVVRVTASNIKKLSTKLTDTARALAAGKEGSEGHQINQENSELLRRDWSSQIHLLTAHIDEITAEVSAPLDNLIETALEASRTDGLAKNHLLKQFEQRATFISDQLQVMEDRFQEATSSLEVRSRRLEKTERALSFLKKLTPHAVGAARSLASEPGSAMLDHFNHLRRQWASKAQYLLVNLKRNTSPCNMSRVLDAFLELLHNSRLTADKGVGSPLQRSYSNEALSDEKPASPVPPGGTPKLASPKKDSSGLGLTPQRTKRPSSMVVPLPSWGAANENDPYNLSSQSIAVAAQSLRRITDEFTEENNPLVKVASKMSKQMSQMAEFSRGRGELQNQAEMIDTAKAIAANGHRIVQFASLIGDHCNDKTIRNELQYCAEMIPTFSTQLRIISSVKAATPEDASADVMLVKNAQNLMKAVIKTVTAAEAACMKGLRAAEGEEEEEIQREIDDLALGWKRKLYQQRTRETIRASRDERGMRRMNRVSTPSIVDVIKPRKSLLTSPPHRH